jgi:hypothetical protein
MERASNALVPIRLQFAPVARRRIGRLIVDLHLVFVTSCLTAIGQDTK